MRCQICQKNDATIHLTEINEGHRKETHLCELCAAQEGIAVKSQIPINELLSSLLGAQPNDEDFLGGPESQQECPNCGFTLDKFRKEAVLGCPDDYEVFEDSLSSLIEKAHNGKMTHCGKVPSTAPKETKSKMELMNLRNQLEAAVRSEDYETAAKLRDQINQLNK
ncbi:MAG: UvrB/UvrC motif-containing protein [Planctomycetota bacterium]|jgi:protein arginine kinase activator